MPGTQALIVGAGPTGLVLALWLNRLGVNIRIIDKTAEPGTTSRALVVHARTLEFYEQLGLADEIAGRGRELTEAELWIGSQPVASVPFGHLGEGISPYPYLLIFPQDEHERLLIEQLAREGVRVERSTELIDFEQQTGHVVAHLKRPDGAEEICEAIYLAGCDGAHSTVRNQLQIGFPGGTYSHIFYVADTQGSGQVMNGKLNIALDDSDFLAVFPMKGEGRVRLVGSVLEQGGVHESFTWRDISPRLIEQLDIKIGKVNWFSTYHVHHRVAQHFRAGRAFLLGDAAHIHSPVGGQGMNTGIGDAVNLAWKIAAVIKKRAWEPVLDTYETERIRFAYRLVNTTDRVFQFASAQGPRAAFARTRIIPYIVPKLFYVNAIRRFLFRTVSQTEINYHGSLLSQGWAGNVRGGDRLPWVQFDALEVGYKDNFQVLRQLEWQVHIYGEKNMTISKVCHARGLPLHEFPWRPAIRNQGIMKNAAYLVRPDGYVALADPLAHPATLEKYLDTRGIKPLAEQGGFRQREE